jgi:hypothetical protein
MSKRLESFYRMLGFRWRTNGRITSDREVDAFYYGMKEMAILVAALALVGCLIYFL